VTTVREAMNPADVTIGSGHSMREAARRMIAGGTGAAVVLDPELPAPGIVTERDLLHCVAEGCDPDLERVAEHLTASVVYAAPDWPLERAAEQMVKGGFRHIIVLEGSEIAGILSMRDIVSRWVREAALAGGAAAF
jgi:signal-transduction protein with cAMP-binding, CBS, and nucleotidyltransferase domain